MTSKTVSFTCKSCSTRFSRTTEQLREEREYLRENPGVKSELKKCPSCGSSKVKRESLRGDSRGGRTASARLSEAYHRARKNEEVASDQESNLEVGDFLSELSTAFRYRERSGLNEGDWLDAPERLYTDGRMFAEEVAVASDIKLQVTLTLDASTSMWSSRLMSVAGPTMLALDRTIRKAMRDMPEGAIKYAPFIFHETASKVPSSYLNSYVGRVDWLSKDATTGSGGLLPNYPTWEQVEEAKRLGELPASATGGEFKMHGDDTQIAPLFRALKQWEETEGDTDALRINIIITDGVFVHEDDVEEASRIQEDRNGRVWTVLLNFLSQTEWEEEGTTLPERCSQYTVNRDNLEVSIKTILSEAISSLVE